MSTTNSWVVFNELRADGLEFVKIVCHSGLQQKALCTHKQDKQRHVYLNGLAGGLNGQILYYVFDARLNESIQAVLDA